MPSGAKNKNGDSGDDKSSATRDFERKRNPVFDVEGVLLI